MEINSTKISDIVSSALVHVLNATEQSFTDIPGDLPLRELGLDSLRLVQFISELEKRAEIEFDLEDLGPRHFATVEAVEALLGNALTASSNAIRCFPSSQVSTSTAPRAHAEADKPGDETRWVPDEPAARLLLCTARVRMTQEHIAQALSLLKSDKPRLDWGTFLDLAARHRVLGLVARNFDRECLGPLGTVRRSTLRSAYLYNRGRAQAWRQERGEILAAFEREGLRPVVRKGSYLAEYIYPDSAMRYMEDMDLYVGADESEQVTRTLERLGYRQGGDSRDRRTVEPVNRETEVFWQLNVSALPPYLRPTSDPYVEMFSIDLRRDLMEPASGKSVPAEDFRERARRVPLAGEHAWVPSDEDVLLDLGVHLTREATTISSIRSNKDLCLIRFLDLTLWYERVSDTLNHLGVVELAERYRVADELYYALHFADLLYPGVLDADLLNRLRPDDLSYLDSYGALDGHPSKWPVSFTDRVFDRHRIEHVSVRSALPRPRRYWTDDHSTEQD